MLNENLANATEDVAIKKKGKENNPNEKKKRKSIPPMWRILGKARQTFDVQLSKTNAVKLQCIEKFMNAETRDIQKFWANYTDQKEKLLDSRKYIRECESLKVSPEIMAEHIVFLGSATINKVLKNGVTNTLGMDLKLYKDRLIPEKITEIFSDETVSVSEE